MPPSPMKAPAPASKAAPAAKVAPRAAPPARVAQPQVQAVEEQVEELDPRLAEIESFFGDSEEKSGFGPLASGKYQVHICCIPSDEKPNVGIGTSKNGRLQVTFELTVVAGSAKGRKAWKRDGIDSPESVGWFKGGLRKLGIDAPLKSAKEIPGVLQQLHDTYAEVTVKQQTDSDYVNVYWNKALDSDSIAADNLESFQGNEAEAAAEGPITNVGTFSINSRVQVDFSGQMYQGAITEFTGGGSHATVKFDDGDVQSIPVESLQEVQAPKPAVKAPTPKAPAPTPAKAQAPAPKPTAAPSKPAPTKAPAAAPAPKVAPKAVAKVSMAFDDSSLEQDHINRADAVCRAHSFDSNEYTTWCDVLCDVAEFCGLSGEYSTPDGLLAHIEALTPSAS